MFSTARSRLSRIWRSPSTGEKLFKLKALSLASFSIYALSTRERRKTLGMTTIAVSEIFEDLKWRWKGYPDIWIQMKREDRMKNREWEIEARKWRAREEKRKAEEAKGRREEEEKREKEEEEKWEKLEELKKMDFLRDGWWYPPKK